MVFWGSDNNWDAYRELSMFWFLNFKNIYFIYLNFDKKKMIDFSE